ncbi:MAG: hypothetical protein SFW67_24500 [Myxococcaceae bacterium]|nr:hypothetical protein [Myxococcaceae bacterium]
MLLLALHLATAALDLSTPPPTPPVRHLANPDGGRKRRDGREDEDAR